MAVLRGVNLGGWLVLEKWITPSVFKGTLAQDEYSLCQELGDKKDARFTEHRQSFITRQDFIWIAEHGFNAVRLPIPHWTFGGFEPFVECVQYVDQAMEWAEACNLQVILDLHTAPGSQ